MNAKDRGQILKRLGLRKNKTQMLAKEIRTGIEEIKVDFPESENVEANQLRNTRKSQREQSKAITYGTCHFKNLYSPFNGIQIKYISTENSPIQLHPSSKKIIPKFNQEPKSFFQKKAPVKEKGIIFKEKGRSRGEVVDGWRVEPDFN